MLKCRYSVAGHNSPFCSNDLHCCLVGLLTNQPTNQPTIYFPQLRQIAIRTLQTFNRPSPENFLGTHTVYRAYRAISFAIAQLSCYYYYYYVQVLCCLNAVNCRLGVNGHQHQPCRISVQTAHLEETAVMCSKRALVLRLTSSNRNIATTIIGTIIMTNIP